MQIHVSGFCNMAGEKILVVDDEKIIGDIFLTAFDEYRIILAHNTQQALDILKHSGDIDLVVLDVMMPGSRGTEILKEIKQMHPDCKVIILTGCSSADLAVETLLANVDEYIEKPFDIEDIKIAFERLLGEKKRKVGADN